MLRHYLHFVVPQQMKPLNQSSYPKRAAKHPCSTPGKTSDSYIPGVSKASSQLDLFVGYRETLLELRDKPECQGPPGDWDLSQSRYGVASMHHVGTLSFPR